MISNPVPSSLQGPVAHEANPTLVAGSLRDVRTILFENVSLAFQQATDIGDVKCTNAVKH